MRNLLILTALGASLSAQSGPLVGFTANPITPSSNIVNQTLCSPPTVECGNPLPAPVAPHAGGLTYSARDLSVWHSQGTRIQQIFRGTCHYGCSMAANLVLGPNSLVGGLTFDTDGNELIHVESVPGVAAIVRYAQSPAGGPCPITVGVCRVILPSAAHLSGGIALDERRDTLWVATSMFGSPAPANFALLVRRTDPSCQVICRVPLDGCGTGSLQAVRAMAYDECADVLYASDGRQVAVFRVVYIPGAACPTLVPVSCCPVNAPGGELYAGFDTLPGRLVQRVGQSCQPTNCVQCPGMDLSTLSDPVIGNLAFGFRISGAPGIGNPGFVLIGLGPCQPLPFGCGSLFPMLPTLIDLGPVPMLGAGACGGAGNFPLPIPPNYALCGVRLCAQGVTVCSTAVFGLALTNGLEVVLGS